MKILKFSADWCRPCKKLTQTLDEMVLPYVVESRDIDAEPGLASDYSVRSVPTMILVDGEGKIIALKLRGEALEKKLEEIFLKK